MKRNNILTYLLFALTAFFPVLYLGYSLFLKGYMILFESLTLWADVLNVLLIGICTAMLICKDKRLGKIATAMLILSVFLLPIDRYLMARILNKSYIIPGTWETVLYLVAAIVMIVTACFYIKNEGLKILVALAFSIIFVFSGFFPLVSYVFSYQNPRDIADIPAPDGIHHVRVVEYADDDNVNWLYKAVYSYNSAESFSIGSIEFVKDWKFIEHYRNEDGWKVFKDGVWIEQHDTSFDENTDITFNDNGTITLKDKTYTYDGKEVTEPPEPPL